MTPLKIVDTADGESVQVNGTLAGLPQWVKAVAVVGAPIVFCAWLLFFVLNTQATKLDAVQMAQIQQTADMKQTKESIDGFLREHAKEIDIMQSILSQICANGAVNKTERDACFPKVEGVK